MTAFFFYGLKQKAKDLSYKMSKCNNNLKKKSKLLNCYGNQQFNLEMKNKKQTNTQTVWLS